MSDKPASYIEFDPVPDTEPEPLDVEESYPLYHKMRTEGDADGIAAFLEAHAHPAEFLKGYEQWKQSQSSDVQTTSLQSPDADQISPRSEKPETLIPSNPNLPPQGNGDVPMFYSNFPMRDAAGQFVYDTAGNQLFTDGQGNVVLNDDRGINDAAALFGKRRG